MKFSIFPPIDLGGVRKAWKNLSTRIKTTMAAGLLTPIWHTRVYPGDDFYIDVISSIESFPLLTAFDGVFEVSYDFFFEPLANLYGHIDNDARVPTEQIIKQKWWTMQYYGAYGFDYLVTSNTVTPIQRYSKNVPVYQTPWYSGAEPPSGSYLYPALPTFSPPQENTSVYFHRSWINPIAAGSLMNYLYYPVGYFGQFDFQRATNLPVWSSRSDTVDGVSVCADVFFAYLDIFRRWFANPQEQFFPLYYNFKSNAAVKRGFTSASERSPLGTVNWNLGLLDTLFMMLRSFPSSQTPQPENTFFGDFTYNTNTGRFNQPISPALAYGDFSYPLYSWQRENSGYESPAYPSASLSELVFQMLSQFVALGGEPNGGLLPCTYKMDLFRGMMNAQGGQFRSTINTSGDTLDITEVWYSNRFQHIIDRLDISGGRFSSWIRSLWRTKPKDHSDVPYYIGSYRYNMGFQDVQQTAGDSAGSPLGTQASIARGVGSTNSRKSARIRFHSDTYGHLLCICSIRPIISYSTGIAAEDMYLTFGDTYNLELQDLGFVDVNSNEIWAIPDATPPVLANGTQVIPDVNDPANPFSPSMYRVFYPGVEVGGVTSLLPYSPANPFSVGRRLAWTEVDTAVDKNYAKYGAFQQLSTWVFNRMYANVTEGTLLAPERVNLDFTTYMKPELFNFMFAETDRDSQNYRVSTYLKVRALRPKGARNMPHM